MGEMGERETIPPIPPISLRDRWRVMGHRKKERGEIAREKERKGDKS